MANTPVGWSCAVDDRQVAVAALGHDPNRLADRGAVGDRCRRGRHHFSHRRGEIGAAGHQLERVALGDDADELGAFADQDGARSLSAKQLQDIADGRVDGAQPTAIPGRRSRRLRSLS